MNEPSLSQSNAEQATSPSPTLPLLSLLDPPGESLDPNQLRALVIKIRSLRTVPQTMSAALNEDLSEVEVRSPSPKKSPPPLDAGLLSELGM